MRLCIATLVLQRNWMKYLSLLHAQDIALLSMQIVKHAALCDHIVYTTRTMQMLIVFVAG